jgi:hypothetical protein
MHAASSLQASEPAPLQLEVAATVLDWCAPLPFYETALEGETAEAQGAKALEQELGTLRPDLLCSD